MFVSDQGANIVCALQQCIRLNCCSHMINTILKNTFKKEFLEISLPHISLLTFEVEDVTYLKQSGLVHHLKTTVCQECESRRYSRIDMCKCFDVSYQDIANILIKCRERENCI
jgi:hypothetical protein